MSGDFAGLPVGAVLGYAALVGAVLGSFLAVVAQRVPAGISMTTPSACSTCHRELSWFENVPIAAYLALRGRCRTCRARVPASVLLFEVGTATAFVLATAVVGLRAQLAVVLLLVCAAVVLGAIDVAHLRLPDVVLAPFAVLLALALAAAALAGDSWWPLLRAVGGALAYGGFMLIVFLARPGGTGLGDVKLALPLGAAVAALGGWGALVVAVFGAYVVAMVPVVFALARRRAVRSLEVPFGPAMLVSATLSSLYGAPLARAYARLTGLA